MNTMRYFILFLMLFIYNSTNSKSNINPTFVKFTTIQKGIDISCYQGIINWKKLDTNINFIICKATEGVTILDTKLKSNWVNIKCIKGTYHFFRPEVSGIKQADFYIDNICLSKGDIKPIIDIEYTYRWRYKRYNKIYVSHFVEMIDEIKKRTGQEPIIYTSASFWNTFIKPYYDKNHILWIADYHHDDPIIPTSFSDWTIWQWSCRGVVSGIPTYVDVNYCNNLDTLLIK